MAMAAEMRAKSAQMILRLVLSYLLIAPFRSVSATADVLAVSRMMSGQLSRGESVLAVRQKLASTLGVSFCEKVPSKVSTAKNLAGSLRSQPFSGWHGSRLIASHTQNGASVVTAHNITNEESGPQITLEALKKGEAYELSAWVKLEGNQKSSILRTFVRSTGPKTVKNSRVAATGQVKNGCWTKVKGGFTASQSGQAVIQLVLDKSHASLSIASFSIQLVAEEALRQDQNQRIDKLRKRKVVLRVRNSAGKPVQAFVEVEQKTSSFAWGAAASAGIARDPAFQQWFQRRFKWAVFQNELKWLYNEPYQGQNNFDNADAMTQTFKSLNLSIRGHSVFWDPIGNIQDWVQKLSKTQLRAAVNKRIKDSVGRYKGQFAHWDINNENLHGQFFEESLQDPNFGAAVFRKVQDIDRATKKFVNEYNIIEYYNDPLSTPETLLEEIYNIQEAGGTVDGIGLQGHFYQGDAARVRAELDALATGGVPIWVTELDFYDPIPENQNRYMDMVMRELFSHPAVRGIIQWEVYRSPCQLYAYPDMTACQDGCPKCLSDESFVDTGVGRMFTAMKNEWLTQRSNNLNNQGNLNFRGFFGDYQIRVYYKEKVYTSSLTVPEDFTRAFVANIKLPVA